MEARYLKWVVVELLVCLTLTAAANADVVIVESVSGGQNFSSYSEDGGGFPNGWQTSGSKSTAPGVTAGLFSRFNTNSAIGGSNTWFQVAPVLLVPGGSYRVDVTTTSASGNLTGIVSTVTVTNGVLFGMDIDTNLPGFQTGAFSSPHNTWNLVGNLTLSPGSNQPAVRFDETANTNRFYADAVRFTLIPEPACVGMLPLLGVILSRRRVRARASGV